MVHPLKTKQAHEIQKAWLLLHQKLTLKETAPSTYIMDNKALKELKHYILNRQNLH